jgi:hypothetical protein
MSWAGPQGPALLFDLMLVLIFSVSANLFFEDFASRPPISFAC